MNQMKITLNENVWKLIYYFIVMEGYNPIIIHGNEDEIWLEKMDGKYNVIRIASKYIHNLDQLDYDYNKVEHIIRSIKKKAFVYKVRMINVFTNLNDSLLIEDDRRNIEYVSFKTWDDLKNSIIVKEFPAIFEKTNFKEKGEQLMMKISTEINKKSVREAKKNAEVFSEKKPYVTYGLIAVNVLIFLLMYILGKGSTDSITLINFGASFPPLIRDGEYFRLLTNGFIHIGITHLLFNNYALYIIGPQIENLFGRVKYITIYLLSIIIASLLSMVFFQGTSAGASGAIFGLLGALLYFGYHYRIYLGNMMQSQLIPLIMLNLLLGFMIPGINNAAHIGGLISGVMIAASLGIKNKTSIVEQVNAIIITLIFVVFLIYLGF